MYSNPSTNYSPENLNTTGGDSLVQTPLEI